MNKKSLILFFAFLILPIISPGVKAANYYVGPNGSDSNSGTSQSTPVKTFSKAMGMLNPGDTLFLLDGTYYETLQPTRNGAPNPAVSATDITTHPLDHPDRVKNYITIKALNDGKAIIDGQFQRQPVRVSLPGGSYHIFEGIVAKNSSGPVWVVTVKNVILRRISAYNASPDCNCHAVSVSAKGTPTDPANILVEDSVMAGSGRKMLLAFATYVNVIFRRNFAAWQWWLGGPSYCGPYWPQVDGIEIYPNSGDDQPDAPINSIVENNINFGLTPHYGISLSPNPGLRRGNYFYGDISLGAGMKWDNSQKKFVTPEFNEATCTFNGHSAQTNCAGLQCMDIQKGYRNGFNIGTFSDQAFRNNTFKDLFAMYNGGLGLNAGPWTENTNNQLINSTFIQNTQSTNPVSKYGLGADTETDSMNVFTSKVNLKIGKIAGQSSSPYNGTGATIQNRYVDGKLTSQPLWPWPMEERIKREFADPNLFQANGIQGQVWTNFSVTQNVCEGILKPNGAVSSCNSSGSTPVPTQPQGSLTGDINGDGVVNILDFTRLSNAFGTNNSAADLNHDGVVNVLDFTILSNNFGRSN